jgi:hypothetical protein
MKRVGGRGSDRKIVWQLGILAAILLSLGQAQAQEAGFAESLPVERLLRDDGTLDLTTGFSGALEVAGLS